LSLSSNTQDVQCRNLYRNFNCFSNHFCIHTTLHTTVHWHTLHFIYLIKGRTLSRASRAKLAILAACWIRICCILASCRCRRNASFVSLYFCCIDAAEEILVAAPFLTLDKVIGRERRLAAHTCDADTGPPRGWGDAVLDGCVPSVARDAKR